MRTALVVGLSFVCSLAAAVPALGPSATLKAKNSEVDKLLHKKAVVGSSEEKKVKDDIKAMAGTLFDYEELAKRSLADHWVTLKPAQQTEFVSTLKQLIERSYTRQLRSNMDYKVAYTGEQLAGKEATVTSVVKVKTRGKDTDAEIVYKMKESPGAWLVYDVITDEVSLVRNYRTQFGKIINEKGYDELIRRMKSKLDETAK